ncbi:MAG: SDR family oxidoreductase [Porticoccaceae bacterium]
MKILFIGCGDIAQRAAGMVKRGRQCYGLRRSPKGLPSYIAPITADAADPKQLRSIATEGFDIWIVTMTPGEFTRQAYEQSYLAVAHAVAESVSAVSNPPKFIIWVSSTSVYGDCAGEWVDETTKPNPVTFSGEILLQAEQVIKELTCRSTIVRFSGIYGPGRTRLIEQVRSGKGRPQTPQQWSNRIHADDCGAVLAHLINLFASGKPIEQVYLASDCQPVTQHEIRSWLAEKLSVDLIEEPVAVGPIRRCSNRLLLQSGFSFRYPSYKEGYAALLENQESR